MNRAGLEPKVLTRTRLITCDLNLVRAETWRAFLFDYDQVHYVSGF